MGRWACLSKRAGASWRKNLGEKIFRDFSFTFGFNGVFTLSKHWNVNCSLELLGLCLAAPPIRGKFYLVKYNLLSTIVPIIMIKINCVRYLLLWCNPYKGYNIYTYTYTMLRYPHNVLIRRKLSKTSTSLLILNSYLGKKSEVAPPFLHFSSSVQI